MKPARVLYAVEGRTDAVVARRLIEHLGRHADELLVARGAHNLDRRIRHWRQPSNRQPLLVVRDLDREECPPELVARLSGPGRMRIGSAFGSP